MNENKHDQVSVYEIGYLLAGVPEERVTAEVEAIKGVISLNGGSVIAEEAPKFEKLAYTMRKKMVSGAYDKYDEAYFGWVKFELSAGKIEGVKKSVEVIPSVLRMLVISTVRENTYLGRRVPADAAFARKIAVGSPEAEAVISAPVSKKEDKPAEPATVEEMDKSIDEMVKEV